MNNEEVTINGDGEQTRDLIYVQDALQGLLRAMESSTNDADIFLLTNTETSVNQVLHVVEDIVGLKARSRHSERLKGDIRRMKYDYNKAKVKLGFDPRFSISDGIKRMVNASPKQSE